MLTGFEGPDFTVKHEIYPAKPQPMEKYADNFFTWVYDFNGDGWNDLLVVGFPGTPAYVYENPRGAFDPGIRPFQRLLGRRSEHDEQARCVGPVFVDQRLRIDAVVLRLGHRAHTAGFHRESVALEPRADALSALVEYQIDVCGVVVRDAPRLGLARKDLVQHHSLRQQVGEGLVDVDQTQVAHHLGPET